MQSLISGLQESYPNNVELSDEMTLLPLNAEEHESIPDEQFATEPSNALELEPVTEFPEELTEVFTGETTEQTLRDDSDGAESTTIGIIEDSTEGMELDIVTELNDVNQYFTIDSIQSIPDSTAQYTIEELFDPDLDPATQFSGAEPVDVEIDPTAQSDVEKPVDADTRFVAEEPVDPDTSLIEEEPVDPEILELIQYHHSIPNQIQPDFQYGKRLAAGESSILGGRESVEPRKNRKWNRRVKKSWAASSGTIEVEHNISTATTYSNQVYFSHFTAAKLR